MKSLIFAIVLFLSNCFCDDLLGGWRVSDDQSLKQECLDLALVQIQSGHQVRADIQSKASDLVCLTQLVNGLNIKCDFVFRGQKWRCSYYKSFVQILDTALDQCEDVTNNDKKGAGKKDEQVVQPSNEEDDEAGLDLYNEEDDESVIDTINEKNNEVDDETVIDANQK